MYCLVRYKGVITDAIRFTQIALPTTDFLDSFVKETDVDAFAIFEIKDSPFNIALTTHMGSEFCMTADDIVKGFFNRKNAYKVKLFRKSNVENI